MMKRTFAAFCAAPVLLLIGCGGSELPSDMELAVTTPSTAFGRVVSEPEGIDCPGACQARFDAGTEVVLRAEDNDMARFEHWEGGCGDARDCRVNRVSGSVEQGVRFAAAPRRVDGDWIGGDVHVHTDHSSDGSLPRQIDQSNPGNVAVSDQIGFAQLRGLDFLSLSDHRTWDQHYNPEWESDGMLLVTAEEANGRPHALVQGSIERILQQDSNNLRALQQSIWDTHAQGAAWLTAHPDRDNTESDGALRETASALGVDGVELWNMARDSDANIAYIEALWNRGYRFGVVGASDNHFRELHALAGPGRPLTQLLVRAPREREVVDALRAGHSLIAARNLGPALRLSAEVEEGAQSRRFVAGDEINVPAGTPVQVRLEVDGGATGRLDVYRDPGRAAGEAPIEQFFALSPATDVFEFTIEAEEGPMWLRAELRGFDLPDSPLITVEELGDNLADLDIPALLESIVALPGQLRAATSGLFIGPAPAEPQPEVALPEPEGSDDGAGYLLGSRDAWSGFPDAASAAGRTHVVAEAHVAGTSRVVYRRVGADGAAEGGLINLSPDSDSARFPRIAAKGDDIWVVWQDERNGEIPRRPAIYARHSADGGRSWEEPVAVRAIEGRAERPVVALAASGAPVVAWQEIRSGRPFDIWAKTLGVDSEPANLSGVDKDFAPADGMDTRSARWPASVWPSIAVGDDGRIAVGWQDNRDDPDPLFTGAAGRPEGTSPDDWNIHVALRETEDGAWQLLPPVGESVLANRFPDVAWDATGALHVVWEAQPLSQSGTVTRIGASRWQGNAWADVETLAEHEDFSAQRPRIGRTADGGLIAAWFDAGAADWRWSIAWARNSGAGWQSAERIAAPGNNTWPAVAANGLVFASTRAAQRLQRDRTQQIFLRSHD